MSSPLLPPALLRAPIRGVGITAMLSAPLLLLVVLFLESTEEAAPSHYRLLKAVSHRRVKIDHSRGRLGNRMREWASGLGVAHRNEGATLCSLTDNGLSAYFHGPFPVCPKDHTTSAYKTRSNDVTGLVLGADDGRDILLGGYLSNCKNFADIHDEVAQAFTLLDEHKEAAATFLESYQHKIKVGIQVRRGDKTRDKTFLPTVQYFSEAIAVVRREMGGTKSRASLAFFVASDDINWCKEQEAFQADDVYFIEGGSVISDFSILLQMDHFITSEGTFGWWAAWLGAWKRGGNVYHTGQMDKDRWCDNSETPRWSTVPGDDNSNWNVLAGA